MKVSVVIPALNEEKIIGRTLTALKRQPGNFEIIVVDNSSTDSTSEIAKRYADKVVSEKNQGVAYARNKGAAAASGEILAFLDADCISSPDWMQAITDSFSDQSLTGLTGPVYPLSESLIAKIFFCFSWTLFGKLAISSGIPLFPGGNSIYRAPIFHASGGFRPDAIPGEDTELSIRLRRSGKFAYSPKLCVWTRTSRFQDGYLCEVLKWLKVGSKLQKMGGWDYGYPSYR